MFSFLTSDEIHLNQIDADDPEVSDDNFNSGDYWHMYPWCACVFIR